MGSPLLTNWDGLIQTRWSLVSPVCSCWQWHHDSSNPANPHWEQLHWDHKKRKTKRRNQREHEKPGLWLEGIQHSSLRWFCIPRFENRNSTCNIAREASVKRTSKELSNRHTQCVTKLLHSAKPCAKLHQGWVITPLKRILDVVKRSCQQGNRKRSQAFQKQGDKEQINTVGAHPTTEHEESGRA